MMALPPVAGGGSSGAGGSSSAAAVVRALAVAVQSCTHSRCSVTAADRCGVCVQAVPPAVPVIGSAAKPKKVPRGQQGLSLTMKLTKPALARAARR
jgi:hypothetical protein